jgi:hypothetical protein
MIDICMSNPIIFIKNMQWEWGLFILRSFNFLKFNLTIKLYEEY